MQSQENIADRESKVCVPLDIVSTHLRITVFLLLATIMLAGCETPASSANSSCSSPLSPAIDNSCVVTPGVLWRGAKPDADGAAALISLGVKTVVNLELLHDDLDAFRDAKPKTVSSTRINYIRIHAWEPNVVIAPRLLDSHVAEFIAIVKSQAKPIFVHCRSGQNRTGVMVAAYRVLSEGWPVAKAVAEMQGFHGVWSGQDSEYIRSLVGEHRTKIERMAEERIGQIEREMLLVCSATGCEENE